MLILSVCFLSYLSAPESELTETPCLFHILRKFKLLSSQHFFFHFQAVVQDGVQSQVCLVVDTVTQSREREEGLNHLNLAAKLFWG